MDIPATEATTCIKITMMRNPRTPAIARKVLCRNVVQRDGIQYASLAFFIFGVLIVHICHVTAMLLVKRYCIREIAILGRTLRRPKIWFAK